MSVHYSRMPKPITIIFCGTPAFAVSSLEALATDDAFHVVLVITQPDRPSGRQRTLAPPPVKARAQELGLRVFQPQDINEELSAYLEAHGIPRPDFLVVVAYGKILAPPILALPAIAPINVHASLLPRWRGASPVEHAILAGDTETGITVQVMSPKLDAGDILAVRRIPIAPRTTTPLLKETLSRLGADLLVTTLKQPLHPVPQPAEGITLCRKLSREDGIVDPARETSEEIDRRVRALNPWPGVLCKIAGRMIKMLATSLAPVAGSVPLPCAHQTTLQLISVQEPGKKAMRADAWKRGIVMVFCALCTLSMLPRVRAQIPEIKDTDGDELLDSVEDANGNGIVDPSETDFLNADTDNGGEADGSELHGGRDPFVKEDDFTFDRDSDGLTNGRERVLGTDPQNPDTDGDGVADGDDPFPLERAYKADTNLNGLPDEWEQVHQLSQTSPSALSATLLSPPPAADIALQDPDGDRLTNEDEYLQGTNPVESDTDRDGRNDGDEVAEGTNPEESACLTYDPDAEPLPDVREHWARDVVTSLQRVRILPENVPVIRGYGTGSGALFLPDRPVTRFEFLKMAVFSSCIRVLPPSEAVTPFPDVPEERPHENADRALERRVVATAVDADIVHGYPDGYFRPDSPVTRAEALKMLLRATRLKPLPDELEPISFSDVPHDAWFTLYIEHAFALRLIEGYPATGSGQTATFRPDAPITRAEAAKIIEYALLMNPGVNGYVLPTTSPSFPGTP